MGEDIQCIKTTNSTKGGTAMIGQEMEELRTSIPEPELRLQISLYENEYSVAKEIVHRTILPAIKNYPKLNLCIIRRFCEVMTNS